MLAATQFSPSYADRVTARFFDAAAFHRRISDFAVLETEDLGAYYFPVEELRDSPLIAEGFLSFGEIFLGVADGFAEYERTRYRTAIAPAPETETIRNAGRDQRCPVPPPNSYPGRRPPPPPHPRAGGGLCACCGLWLCRLCWSLFRGIQGHAAQMPMAPKGRSAAGWVSASSRSRLYLATRSPRAGAPDLI